MSNSETCWCDRLRVAGGGAAALCPPCTSRALRTLYQQTADMIQSMAESHYARDIRGELALTHWKGIAQTLRELHPPS